MTSRPKAIVLLSGGLDSATALAIASRDYACHTISFNYSQRHVSELNAAQQLAHAFAAGHQKIQLDEGVMTGSALTDNSIEVPTAGVDQGIPVTYVPARNTIFLAHALAVAEVQQSSDIFIGVNAVDYSGYPDCRPAYIEAFERMANLATRAGVEGHRLRIHAPLIQMSKAEIIATGTRLGVDYSLTVSCYQADDQGRACGVCDSCRLRRAGFEAAGVADPTRYRPD
jgi:7-cyano-7-deazaguanine synthase